MELLLLLYAMLAGLAGFSGQSSPSRAHEVAMGSPAAVEIARRGVEAAIETKAVAAARAARPPAAARDIMDARRSDAPLIVLALVPLSRQAPERRLE